MKYFAYGIGACLLLFLQACTTTQETRMQLPQGSVVWSNDNKELAVVEVIPDPTRDDHQQYQIFVRRPDGSDNRQVTEVRKTPVKNLFYMKAPDYLITETEISTDSTRFDKVYLDGREITIMETRNDARQLCPNPARAAVVKHTVLPSPDGQRLAHVYSQACGQATVEFLQAKDLLAVDAYSIEISSAAQALWHPQGYLIIAQNDGETAWQLNVEQDPIPVTYPACLYPATSSSNLSSTGQRVFMQEGRIKLVQEDARRAFGCQ